MKIASVVCTYPPYKGGIGTAASNLRKIFAGTDFEIHTFTPDYGLETDKEEDQKNKIERIKPLFKFGNGAFLPKLFFCLRDFDVIYLHYPFFGGAELVYLFKLLNPRKRLIIHYHMDVVGLSPLARLLSLPSCFIFSQLFKKADLIITASLDYIKRGSLRDIYKKYSHKFKQVPYVVDIDRFRPEEKEGDIVRLLFVGGLDQAHYFKGVAKLLEAVSLLKKEGINNWQLAIVGSGNLEDDYKKKARDLGINDKVDFLGNLSDQDLSKTYTQSHLTILPSTNKGEAFGIVLIESMASGTPVLASDLAGVRDVFTDSQEGFLVEPGNISALKEKLKELIEDKDKLSVMGKKARILAESKYSQAKVFRSLEKILMNIHNKYEGL